VSHKDRVLACVEYVHKANRGFNPEFVRLAPLMRWDDCWVPVADPVEEYPSEGLVYWARPKGLRLERGQVWLVELENRFGGEDTYRVRSRPVRPWEAVSVPGANDAVALRRALAGRGFELTPRPVGLALIACPDRPDVWLAPFDAHVAPDGTFENGFSSGFARLLALGDAQFFDATVDGVRRRFVDGAALIPEARGAFAVQSDEDLIVGLGRHLRRWDQEAFDAIGTTQTALAAHARALARVTDGESGGRDEARQEAVAALLAAEAVSRESAGRLAEAVARHPAVAGALAARVAEEADRRRAELDAEFAARRAELEASVARAVADGEARLAELREECAELERAIQALEGELALAVERQVAGGLPRLADHVMTRVLLGKASAPLATPLDGSTEVAVAPRRLDSVEALRNATSARALASGLDPLLAVTAAGLLLGRRCLLVGGAGAAQLSTALAETLGGYRIYRVRTSPTLFSVSDLLAVPVAGVGANEVAPLGDRLAEAAVRAEVAVLILHGCNRAPPEGALADLVDAVTPGAGGLAAPWTDRRGVARVAPLDGRLLVVGTLVEGSTSFRVPEALARRVPLVDADRRLVEVDLPAPDAPVEATAVGGALWEALASAEATIEQAFEWLAATGEADGERVLRRYLGAASAVLSHPSAAFESLLAMTVGRPAFERPDIVRLLSADRASAEDLQASHRRLAPLIERRAAW
jgi:hypothetical protein